jgi:hypothetical protein
MSADTPVPPSPWKSTKEAPSCTLLSNPQCAYNSCNQLLMWNRYQTDTRTLLAFSKLIISFSCERRSGLRTISSSPYTRVRRKLVDYCETDWLQTFVGTTFLSNSCAWSWPRNCNWAPLLISFAVKITWFGSRAMARDKADNTAFLINPPCFNERISQTLHQ